jgi:hypothetical protein
MFDLRTVWGDEKKLGPWSLGKIPAYKDGCTSQGIKSNFYTPLLNLTQAFRLGL